MFSWFKKNLSLCAFILAGVSFVLKYVAYHFEKNFDWFFDPAFTFFLIVAISIYFDNKTREDLFKRLDEYFRKITVPNFEEIRTPVKEFMTHLNAVALPYEKERKITLHIVPMENNDNFLQILNIYQVDYSREHLEKLSKNEVSVYKGFKLAFPKHEINDVNISSNESNEEELKKSLREKVYLTIGDYTVSLENLIRDYNHIGLLEEDVFKAENNLFYSFLLAIPIESLLKCTIPSFKIEIKHLFMAKDFHLFAFRTFCETFRLNIFVERSLFSEDVKKHIQVIPVSFKRQRELEEDGMFNYDCNGSICEILWRNVLPGSTLFVEWNFTPSSPPAP